jgi:hypothetical protein
MKSIHDLVIALLIGAPLFACVTMLMLATHDEAPPSAANQVAIVTTHGY